MTGPTDKLIAAAAKTGLAPLGVRRKGRSRTWIDDHGWWLINVEFQPSSWATGCYLNVGTQHLWVPRGHLCFENHERPLGGSHFVEFTGDEDSFATAMIDVVDAAASAVRRLRDRHGEGLDALRSLASDADDLIAGVAATVLGDRNVAQARLRGQVHPAYAAVALEYLSLDADDARAKAAETIALERQTLRLLPLTVPPPW